MILLSRKEFDDIINKYGHYIIYGRSNRNVRCTCWDDIKQEADPSCEECLGEGYPIQYEKIKTRFSFLSGNILESSYGLAGKYSSRYYFRWDFRPQVSDNIYEVEWDKKGWPAIITDVKEAKGTFPFRDEKGAVVYWEVPVNNEPVNFKMRSEKLVKIIRARVK